ncbi:MAG: hypothetical protein U0176_05885 [Bacteroidia bacterium]
MESVAWVTERKDVMYGMFYIGALVAYLRYRATTTADVCCCILFILALFSKIRGSDLAPIVHATGRWTGIRAGEWEKRVLLEKLPIFHRGIGGGTDWGRHPDAHPRLQYAVRNGACSNGSHWA